MPTAACYGLALHTTSPELGLALSNFAGDDRAQVWELGLALSTHLHLHLQEFLPPQSWSDLAFLAVAKGPGSFTGTRIGMVTARTLAQQLNLPLFAISSLAAVARSHCVTPPDSPLSESDSESDIAVQMPASRGQVFTAIYAAKPQSPIVALLPDAVLSLAEWEEQQQRWPRPLRLILAPEPQGKMVANVLTIAYSHWQQGERPDWAIALPFYGQHPVP